MPDTLYEHDALAWSEQQADLLRRLAAGERINDTPDWANIVEEIQDVGLSELHSVESLLIQALAHLLKLRLEPESPAARHWRAETTVFLSTATRRYTPSMRQRIDLPDLFKVARRAAVTGARDDAEAGVLPQACPYTLDDLLAEDADPTTLAARLNTPQI